MCRPPPPTKRAGASKQPGGSNLRPATPADPLDSGPVRGTSRGPLMPPARRRGSSSWGFGSSGWGVFGPRGPWGGGPGRSIIFTSFTWHGPGARRGPRRFGAARASVASPSVIPWHGRLTGPRPSCGSIYCRNRVISHFQPCEYGPPGRLASIVGAPGSSGGGSSGSVLGQTGYYLERILIYPSSGSGYASRWAGSAIQSSIIVPFVYFGIRMRWILPFILPSPQYRVLAVGLFTTCRPQSRCELRSQRSSPNVFFSQHEMLIFV